MPIYFQKGDYQKIDKHNIDDLNTSEKLFEFLKKMNPELLPFESVIFMKSVYVWGSMKFYREMLKLLSRLKIEGITCYGPDDLVEGFHGISACFAKIDKVDIVFIVNPGGYVGTSVSADIGYAYAKRKPVYALEPISDSDINELLSGVLSENELIALLKQKGSK